MSIIALSIIGMLWSLAALWRWYRNSQPDRRPYGWLKIMWHVVLPLVINLLLGVAITITIPAGLGVSVRGLMFVDPDFGYTMAMSGVVAFVWIIRTVLAYFALRGVTRRELSTVQKPVLAQK